MGPINYLGMMPQEDFLQSIQAGLQLGGQFKQARLQAQQQEAALAAKAQYDADVANAMQNPTASAFASLALKYPKEREAYKQAWDQLDASERKGQGEAALQAAHALESGQPQVAKEVLNRRIAALENSGQDASAEKQILSTIDSNPGVVRGQLLQWAAFTQDPTKFAENFGKLGSEQRAAELQPDLVRKGSADADGAVADAQTKGVTAKYAEQNAVSDLETKGWNIKALQGDIEYKRNQTQIGYLNAKIAREGNELQKQKLQLELDKAVTERDTKIRERADEAVTQIDGAKAVTALIDDIFADPSSLNAVTGASAWKGSIPGTQNRAVAGKIEQLQNMLAILNIDKLKGPTSDRDIMFLKQIAANLDRYQSEGEFKKVLGRVRDITVRRESQLRSKYGVPDSQENPQTGARNVVVDY